MSRGGKPLVLVLVAYAAGYVAFPPRVLLVNDEEGYVTQAMAFARGDLTLPGGGRPVRTTGVVVASDYPPGTSLLQTPLVAVAGWPAAGLLSVLGLAALAGLTYRRLVLLGLDPRFALVVPAFPGSLFFGRVAMSDMPNAALVALTLWLLAGAGPGARGRSFGAGAAAGATLLFREPTAVLLAPFLLGALARRRVAAAALLAGGAAAVALRLALAGLLFGDPLFVRDPDAGFALGSLAANLPVYAIVLLVLFPLGAVLPFLYRGPWRVETIMAFALYVLLFLLYDYDAWSVSGPAKGTVLASRFMLPVLPLLAAGAADLHARHPGWAARWRPRATYALLVAGLGVAAFSVHPLVRGLEAGPLGIVAAMHAHTSPDVPVIINAAAAGKYMSPAYGERRVLERSRTDLDDVERVCRERGALRIAFLERTDSELFRADAAENARFLAAVEARRPVRPVYDRRHGPASRVYVGEVACDDGRSG